jgi:hypothetical protein
MIAGKLDLEIKKGCTFYKVLTWEDSAGTPIDITGWTPQCDARKSLSGDVEFDLGVTVTDGAAGEFTMEISDEDTAELTAGSYRYDLIFDKPDGTRSEPVIEGRVVVKQVNSQKA